MAELEQARALWSRARGDLEPRQWETLEGKLTEAQRAFERFSSAAQASGRAAEVSRGAEGFLNTVPNNSFPGGDVLVNGKNFDALQLATRTLWDVKTDDFDKHDSRTQDFFIQLKLPEIQREGRLSEACGYKFVIGVRSQAHKMALERADGTLKVVLMDWC